jgi:hypothetical protein
MKFEIKLTESQIQQSIKESINKNSHVGFFCNAIDFVCDNNTKVFIINNLLQYIPRKMYTQIKEKFEEII